MAPFSADEMKCYDEIQVSEMQIPLSQNAAAPTKEEVLARKRAARDWSGYLTEESAARRPSALKAAFQHLSLPGIISLGGGLPLPAYFPIHEVMVKVPRVGKWTEEETATHGSEINIVKYSKAAPRSTNGVNRESDVTLSVNGLGLAEATEVPTVGLSTTLQYGLGTGEPNLVAFLKKHTQMVHNPPYEDWSTTLTCGNTYSFYICLRMLVERGDYIVMEDYTYSSAISTCAPLGSRVVGAEMDSEGMTPQGLDFVMTTWDARARRARKPRVIYLVPYFHFQRSLTGCAHLLS
jgi:aromatic amino acid aminotransferase I / 2-aminoadipate transaminase